MRVVAAGLAALAIAAVAAGCGGSTAVTFSHGVIHVGSNVETRTLTRSVLGIAKGTRESDVRRRLGPPFANVATGHERCLAYHAIQDANTSSLDAIDFCIGPGRRVARILLGVHL